MNDDPIRLLHERCLLAAKKHESNTGFIAQEERIAVYDNFLFCLALFKSKTHENIFEARKLLDHLLYFQQGFSTLPSHGNFPVLVSDYPYCHDHLQAIRCLVVQIWIMREFSQVLGQELKGRLEASIELVLNFLEKITQEVKFPVWAKCKYAAALKALNRPYILPDLADTSDLRTWGDPYCLAEMITAYQLAPSSEWDPFWQYLSSVWHEPSLQVVGPAYKLGFQHPNLLCAMKLFNNTLDKVQAYPLYSALLTNEHKKCEVTPISGTNDRFSWRVEQMPTYAISSLTGKQSPPETPGLFPYYLVTGPHSLAIQAPMGYSPSELVFEIPSEVFLEEKEKAKGLVIAFNDHPHNQVLVGGKTATCFTMKDPLQITLGGLSIDVGFTITSGDGEFVGHVARGNRSGHCQERYTAQDVIVFLRALRGSKPTTIRVDLKLLDKSP